MPLSRIGSMKDVLDIAFELPAGADPYEPFDFAYNAEEESEEELRKTWRVFTKVKDVLDNGRRLENASWRLWYRTRAGMSQQNSVDHLNELASAPPKEMSALEKYDRTLDQSLRQAEAETDRMVGEMFSGGMDSKFAQENMRREGRARAERARALLDLQARHEIPDAALDDLLNWVHDAVAQGSEAVEREAAYLPRDAAAAASQLADAEMRPRPQVAAFCHSLERNGANNFLLYLLRELREELAFEVFSPKEGAMRADYEALGIPVRLCDMKSATYPADVRAILDGFKYAVANTIMTTEVINASKELGIPCLWVIHEAWPQDQFDYYAKEVFLMKHLDGEKITSAFKNASKIVFPAKVQRRCYEGLFSQENARVIYNGIPLASINAFRASKKREEVRRELGYGPKDLLLVQLGTVCKRKAQLFTSQAFAQCVNEVVLPDGMEFRLLMVGARYIRQHEMDYIDSCKNVLSENGCENLATILDVRKNVLPFYLAADIILCPSLNEVLPLVICEGMAFERPVIATKIDGIPEALDDGKEGFLIPPANSGALAEAIMKLAADADLRASMGAAGRQRVLKQFSFSTMSKTYRETISVDLVPDEFENGTGAGPVAAKA